MFDCTLFVDTSGILMYMKDHGNSLKYLFSTSDEFSFLGCINVNIGLNNSNRVAENHPDNHGKY